MISLRLAWILTAGAYLMAMLVSFVTQRSLLEYTIIKLSFDPMSYWSRNLIWYYASESIAQNPWLGTGLGRWERPSWMDFSIDNHFLLTGVRHGLPGLCLLAIAVVACMGEVGLKQGLDKRQSQYRASYVIVISKFVPCWSYCRFLGCCLCAVLVPARQRHVDN